MIAHVPQVDGIDSTQLLFNNILMELILGVDGDAECFIVERQIPMQLAEMDIVIDHHRRWRCALAEHDCARRTRAPYPEHIRESNHRTIYLVFLSVRQHDERA